MDAFKKLNAINCNDHTEEKSGLTYLSWAWAWAEVKKLYPASYYTVYENKDGLIYHTDGKTCWVKTGVTVVDGQESLEHIEYLPVMDFRNKSIPVGQVTSYDVNKTIQRSLTKACARHGLGLYIYAGEDIPEEETVSAEKPAAVPQKPQPKQESAPAPKPAQRPASGRLYVCEKCGEVLHTIDTANGQMMPEDVAAYSKDKTKGHQFCPDCLKAWIKEQKEKKLKDA